ncbi:MAG: Translational regulator CsrA [Planctomycetota bacterium]|nr:Translational regulator CsrA [Planctomycetota bacterium]
MLVLSRKLRESIVVAGGIRITVTSITGQNVRLAIQAPQEVTILREELLGRANAAGRGVEASVEPAVSEPTP